MILLALTLLVLSPVLLVTGLGDARRYLAIRRM